MKSKYLKAASFVSLVSFTISGCAATPDGQKTQAQGTAGGAALGALTGFLTSGGSWQGAVTGAIAGGTAGFAYGSAVAARKAKYASAEAWLNQEIAIANQANARAVAYNQSLKRRLAAVEGRVSAAKAANDKNALRQLKSEVGQIQTEAKQQAKSDAAYEKDQNGILADAKAKSSSNYGQYRQASQSWNNAKSERTQLVGQVAKVGASIGG
jgi:hypothetical protein